MATAVRRVEQSDVDGGGNAILNSANVPGIEKNDIVPCPESPVGGGNTTRADQTVLNGASFTLRCACEMDRILFRIQSQSAAPTLAIGIYQEANGGSGVADKVATVTGFAIGAAGEFEAVFAEGVVAFKPGIIYILFGRDSAAGSYTINTYDTPAALHLLVQNVPATVHRTAFQTAISVAGPTAPPLTFNPLADATDAGTAKTALICRMRQP